MHVCMYIYACMCEYIHVRAHDCLFDFLMLHFYILYVFSTIRASFECMYECVRNNNALVREFQEIKTTHMHIFLTHTQIFFT